ncbi:MAG: transcription termination/antitermination protein NusG [Armatimonadetes bacterium]|nr:transcription termination/antitermination protein NusG [Armatimonadota bacterium]NIM22822.1 transcription termination/antitermination protein NusG [Armatimonadota bacterium]NIM66689.1 transcription termination/antitermination protein NusG [Armatimonadota bacterium]NIM75246.1 transcription termination/antitermination protein NusG [Armatimonadota bacterium]NIN04887.1 transcription termination/antitermination protein NusG [Armatimonadota bacterium]
MEKQWYVVHAFTGQEERVARTIQRRAAAAGLENRFGRVLVLSEEELKGTRRGKRQITRHKVYPGYVFVEMVLDDSTRHLVQSTSGVTGFIGPNRQPVPLSQTEIDNLLQTVGSDAPRIKAAWHKGDLVRIISEPFDGIQGTIDEVNLAKEKLRVLVSIFGRETPVDLNFGDVEKID